MSDPLVSIFILTYNHEKYIRSAIEGCLMQETSFPYEIIIHDDASTDGTTSIIMEYAEKYPKLIVPIIQNENQYQKGIYGGIRMEKFILPLVSGKYIAYCEGDDYWINPNKLQKQVICLESHPESFICFHDVLAIWENKIHPPAYFCPKNLRAIITIEDIINGPWVIHVSSVLARKELYMDFPKYEKDTWAGDLSLFLWAAHKGNLIYLNEIMSIYRRLSTGAMSSTDPIIKLKGRRNLYDEFNEKTNYKYMKSIENVIRHLNRDIRYFSTKKKMGLFRFLLYPRRFLKIILSYSKELLHNQ